MRRAIDSTGFETVGFAAAGAESFQVEGLPSGQPRHFRVRALNGPSASEWSPEAVAMPVLVRHDCLPGSSNPQTLCLQEGRFEVRVLWRDPRSGDHGEAGSSGFDFSDDSGTFWFFDPTNVELVVKVLDARTVNGFQWAFYGALSDVEYWITITDTQTQRHVPQPSAGDLRAGRRAGLPAPGDFGLEPLHRGVPRRPGLPADRPPGGCRFHRTLYAGRGEPVPVPGAVPGGGRLEGPPVR